MPFISLEIETTDGSIISKPCYWVEDVDHILRSVVLKNGIDSNDVENWTYKIVSDDPQYT